VPATVLRRLSDDISWSTSKQDVRPRRRRSRRRAPPGPRPRRCALLLLERQLVLGMAAVQHAHWPDYHPAPLELLVSITARHSSSLWRGSDRVARNSNPIQDATASTLACNDDGTSGALQLTASVAAGTAITAYWNQVWPHPYGPMVSLALPSPVAPAR
jgi:hypothetical protein